MWSSQAGRRRQRFGGGRTRADIKRGVCQPSGDGQFGWFRLQNHHACRFPRLALKSEARSVPLEDGDGARGAITKLASRRNKIVKMAYPIRCFKKDEPFCHWHVS
jgi:hypothetical protein